MNIRSTNLEKDLGIIIDNKVTFSYHIDSKVKKANELLGIIKRTFSHMDKDMFAIIYKSLIRPHLEYCNPIWSACYSKDKIELENVQRRATKILPQLQNM